MTVPARSPVLPEAPVLAAGFAGAGWLDIALEALQVPLAAVGL